MRHAFHAFLCIAAVHVAAFGDDREGGVPDKPDQFFQAVFGSADAPRGLIIAAWPSPEYLVLWEMRKPDSHLRKFLRMSSDEVKAVEQEAGKEIDKTFSITTDVILRISTFEYSEMAGKPVRTILKRRLSTQKYARFESLIVQVEGLAALQRKDIAIRVDLSEAQLKKIRSLTALYHKESRIHNGALIAEGPPEQGKSARAALRSLQTELDTKILKILTESQQKALLKFEYPERSMAKLLVKDE